MRAFVGVVMVSLLASVPALAAGSSLPYARGGRTESFETIVQQYNQSGEPFRIEGRCNSACTMFLAIRNVCVVGSAQLGFHSGHDRYGNLRPAATNRMLNSYNAKLRAYVVANHYMETTAFHTISGRDIITRFGYRECK
jgi:hypothetical protein